MIPQNTKINLERYYSFPSINCRWILQTHINHQSPIPNFQWYNQSIQNPDQERQIESTETTTPAQKEKERSEDDNTDPIQSNQNPINQNRIYKTEDRQKQNRIATYGNWLKNKTRTKEVTGCIIKVNNKWEKDEEKKQKKKKIVQSGTSD